MTTSLAMVDPNLCIERVSNIWTNTRIACCASGMVESIIISPTQISLTHDLR